MQKSWVKTVLTAFFNAKGNIHHEFLPEKQTVNGKFYKEAIEFQENGPSYLLHNNASAHSSGVVSEFFAKRGIPVLSHPPYSPDLSPADFFLFPKLKIAKKKDEIRGCFIDPTDCDERSQGDKGRSVFSGIRLVV
jgi:hypothetical protein